MMSLENNEQNKQEYEALKKRIAELEYELKYRKENSTMTGEVFNIPLSSESYEFVIDEAKKQKIHAGEYINKLVMNFIDEIMPYFEAFEVKDDSELSKARQELWDYLKPRCNMQDLFSLMAKAEISPNEHNQLNEHNEK
ncbi:hypothetical protein, partial [Psychrobacter celer]|uniref:hypothetical protein n=2 Tax=Psychrobacter celer TaxID=306572 RepID=UPI003FD3D957